MVRAGEARALTGLLMRELREAAGVSIRQSADRSGWDRGHLSRVERGATKPSLALVEWYDRTFGAGGALVRQFQDLDAAVRLTRDVELGRGRGHGRPGTGGSAGGSAGRGLPVDYCPSDRSELVGETVPDGTMVGPGQEFDKSWRLRNAGDRPWVDRHLTRQGRPGPVGWLRSPASVPIPSTRPGEEVEITVPLRAPLMPGSSVAYFKMTDDAGRPYFPDRPFGPLSCSVLIVEPLPGAVS